MVKEGDCSSWFYLRFFEYGPHIRLRIKDFKGDKTHLLDPIKEFIHNYPSVMIDYKSLKSPYGQDLNSTDSKDFIEEGNILEVPYIPEYQKYGGEDAISYSESFFHVSSKIASLLIDKTKYDFNKRFTFTLDLMLLTALSLDLPIKKLPSFFYHYAKFWEKYMEPEMKKKVSNKAQQLFEKNKEVITKRVYTIIHSYEGNKTPINEIHDIWKVNVTNLANDYKNSFNNGKLIQPSTGKIARNESEFLDSIFSICFSHIHMTNNRLGLSQYEEFYLGLFIYLAFKQMGPKIGVV